MYWDSHAWMTVDDLTAGRLGHGAVVIYQGLSLHFLMYLAQSIQEPKHQHQNMLSFRAEDHGSTKCLSSQ
jgi:hypothetical protein